MIRVTCNLEHWVELGKQTDWFDRPIGELNGRQMAVLRTAYGDGRYRDRQNREYPVDAGLLGAVPIELIDDDSSFRRSPACEHLVTFERPFSCFVNRNGVHRFGYVRIDTTNSENS